MKKIILIIGILIGLKYNTVAQIIPNEGKLQGIWRFHEKQFYNYLVFKKNKKIEISFLDQESFITDNPHSYFGFWNPEKHEDEPKHLSDLEKEGVFIRFYDNLGTSYDNKGNLFQPTRKCGMSINEDTDDTIPQVLRFYYKGTPDIYSKVDSIPDEVLISLKKNTKDWEKYIAFMDIKERIIKASKANIYTSPNSLTKMYLIKGDEVEVIEEKNEWLRIRYYGKKVIEGWIKKSDIE